GSSHPQALQLSSSRLFHLAQSHGILNTLSFHSDDRCNHNPYLHACSQMSDASLCQPQLRQMTWFLKGLGLLKLYNHKISPEGTHRSLSAPCPLQDPLEEGPSGGQPLLDVG